MEEFNLSKVVCEYVAARDAHELATRPLNSHAPVRRLPHGSPITRRWCDARESLRLALENRQAIPTYQSRVAHWMGLCFDTSRSRDITERGDRFLEEALELLQANGYDQTRVSTLVNYVYGRPVGDPAQEVGGVMVTLAAYCDVSGLDMHHAGDTELARVMQPSVMDKIRAKQAAKNSLHFDTPLPGNAGSAPVGVGIGAHALAGEIAAAVSADEAGEGCDLSAGLFGPAMTQLIRRIVEEYLSKPVAAQEAGAVALIAEALKHSKPMAYAYPEARKRHEDALAAAETMLASTPAAPVAASPGIDLPGWAFERPSGADVIVISAPNGKTWIAEPDDRLHMLAAAVIDASPKGGSDERERFESWASKYWSVDKGMWAGELRYHSDYAQRTWDAWQAALQATSADGGNSEVLEALRKRAEFPDYVTLDYAKDGDGTGPAWWKRRRFELENSGYTLWYEADNGTETYVLVGLGDDLRNAIASVEVGS